MSAPLEDKSSSKDKSTTEYKSSVNKSTKEDKPAKEDKSTSTIEDESSSGDESSLGDETSSEDESTTEDDSSAEEGENFDKKDQVLIGGLNVNGLRNKSKVIKSLILSYQFDIFVITETKFTSNDDDLEDKYKLQGYSNFKFNRPRVAPGDNGKKGAGGGILIYCRKSLGNPTQFPGVHIPKSDIQILQLSFPNPTALNLIAVYHPPKANSISEEMREEAPRLDVLLQKEVSRNVRDVGSVVLIGDTNLKASVGTQLEIINGIKGIGQLEQIIDVVTRVEMRYYGSGKNPKYRISHSLIDHIYVGEAVYKNIISSGVQRFGISDHDLIYCNIKAPGFNPPRVHQNKSVAVEEIEHQKLFFISAYEDCLKVRGLEYVDIENQQNENEWLNLLTFDGTVREMRELYCDTDPSDACEAKMRCHRESDRQVLIELHPVDKDSVCAPCYIRSKREQILK